MKQTRFGVALLAAVVFVFVAGATRGADPPRIYTNESYVEDVMRPTTLPISDPKAMFAFVLENLPESVKVYPTENYYYFYFYHNGTRYAGNIRLDASDRDEGKVYFAYYADLQEWNENIDDSSGYVLLGRDDDVTVEKLERFVYRISYGQKSVVFELNDLSKVAPPAAMLGPDDKFIGPIFDESAIRFFLIYNKRLKIFHYVLDETVAVADELVPTKRTDSILTGRRTGFAFYRDHRLDRKILIGVYDANSNVNNYFDGPFDQLPDNFIKGEDLRNAILEGEPSLAGKIGRLGDYPGGDERYLISPYAYYHSENDLYPFHRCATSKKVPRDMYNACFVVEESDNGSRALPLPLAKKIPK